MYLYPNCIKVIYILIECRYVDTFHIRKMSVSIDDGSELHLPNMGTIFLFCSVLSDLQKLLFPNIGTVFLFC